uniref:Transposase n=1 Tax=Heterorhabditis bacteriophora TaxID=37862 RepID=A0A1I7WZD7_HETBA
MCLLKERGHRVVKTGLMNKYRGPLRNYASLDRMYGLQSQRAKKTTDARNQKKEKKIYESGQKSEPGPYGYL